jgi:hypothetical protein
MRPLVIATALALAGSGIGSAQSLEFEITPQVALVSHSEVNSTLQFDGMGFGGAAHVSWKRWGLDVDGLFASLDPDDEATATESYDLSMLDLRVSYRVVPAIAVQVGAAGRTVSPEFAAPDVGYFRIGLLSDNALARNARVWVRGGYLVAPQFNGGGSAGFAFDIGLGTWVGTSNGRYGLRAEYDFQRIDRTVNDTDVPIQMMVAKVGVQIGF